MNFNTVSIVHEINEHHQVPMKEQWRGDIDHIVLLHEELLLEHVSTDEVDEDCERLMAYVELQNTQGVPDASLKLFFLQQAELLCKMYVLFQGAPPRHN